MSSIHDLLSRFGFERTPFTREFSTNDRFRPDAHEETLKHLRRVVDERMSASLIAPAGCGKTTLLRTLRDALPSSRYRCSYLKVTDLSKRDFCRELSQALGLAPTGTYPTLVRRLQQHLEDGFVQERLHWLIILDEAQEFRPDVLGILRILTNFDMDSRLVVSLLLSGQMPLRKLLEREAMRAVADRLAHRATLGPLTQTDMETYIAHRCRIAGADRVPFDNEAIHGIFDICQGNYRACDRLAYKSLEIAHDKEHKLVGTEHVIAARRLLS